MDSIASVFMEKIDNLFDKGEFSDCTIEIIETNNLVSQSSNFELPDDKNVENQNNETLFCTIPVHCNILCLQWEYFNVLLQWQSDKDKKLVQMKVHKGEGQYLNLFIKCFYNCKILEKMKICEFLHTIEIADRYSCDSIIEYATTLIPLVIIEKVSECNYVGERISSMHYGLSSMKKVSENLMSKCGYFLANFFCPLEEKILEFEEEFLNLSFNAFLSILKFYLCYDENSVLSFVVLWLENNPSNQTSENIKVLLQNVNDCQLSVDFLLDVITDSHPILSKFEGFSNWFVTVIVNKSLPNSRPHQSDNFQLCNMVRNVSKEERLPSYQLLFEKVDDDFYKSNKLIVYKGYLLQITFQLREDSEEASEEHKVVHLNMKCSNFTGIDRYEDVKARKLLEFDLAFTIRYGEEDRNNILPGFQGVHENELFDFYWNCIRTIRGCQFSCHYKIVQVDCNYLHNVDSFDMFLVIKDRRDKWPETFPKYLRNNNW